MRRADRDLCVGLTATFADAEELAGQADTEELGLTATFAESEELEGQADTEELEGQADTVELEGRARRAEKHKLRVGELGAQPRRQRA